MYIGTKKQTVPVYTGNTNIYTVIFSPNTYTKITNIHPGTIQLVVICIQLIYILLLYIYTGVNLKLLSKVPGKYETMEYNA